MDNLISISSELLKSNISATSLDIVSARPIGNLLISATNDVDAISEWLERYKDSPNTLVAARKDAERFYLWIVRKSITLKEVKKADCEEYRNFLRDPQPSSLWCGPTKPRHKKDGTNNPEWRPFVGQLKDSSVRQTCTQLFGLFEFLSHAQYIAGNPWRLLGKMAGLKTQIDIVERFLDNETMAFLRRYIEAMKEGTKNDKKHYSRVRWMFSLLYLAAARRSEFVNAQMKDFRRVNGRWWWKVNGKGSVSADVPVNDELLSELMIYRASLGLSPLPLPDEEIPLVSDVSKKLQPITSSALYKVIKAVFEGAAEKAENEDLKELSITLKKASTHWMRHTSATDQANAPGADLVTVKTNLRHSDVRTTMLYVHAERNKRHDQTQEHKMWIVEKKDE